MSKIEGFVPTNKNETSKKPQKARAKPVEDCNGGEEDDLRLTEDPLAQEDHMIDAENEFRVQENAENMIGEILDDESDALEE